MCSISSKCPAVKIDLTGKFSIFQAIFVSKEEQFLKPVQH